MIEGIHPNTSELLPFPEYDLIIVSYSGGKDSTACLLHLLELGVPREQIELWHQAVDGRPGVDPRFFDWPCTESYCRAFAQVMNVPIKFQWREGGMEREINKVNAPLAPASFELPDGSIGTVGGHGDPHTRLMFPMPTRDLRVRWCSSTLKIDVASAAINNDPRLKNANVLMVTGERRQESPNRAKYATVEEHKSTTRNRRVDQWRPVIEWTVQEVWEIIERWRIMAHPAYHLGWGRLSCMSCIFGDEDQWASLREINPALFERILDYERGFGKTIKIEPPTKKKRKKPWPQDIEAWANDGKSFVPHDDPELIDIAMSEDYSPEHILIPEGQPWILPIGAYKQAGGPS